VKRNQEKEGSKMSRTPTRSIGLFIKRARKSKGLSQEELAHLLGYDSGQFISDWERGFSAVPMKRLADVSKILSIEKEELFEMLLEFSVERLSLSMRQEFKQQISKKR